MGESVAHRDLNLLELSTHRPIYPDTHLLPTRGYGHLDKVGRWVSVIHQH